MKGNDKVRVGPLTLALGLIAGGLALLAYNFGGVDSLEWMWRLWPLLLIGLGLEYFIRKVAVKDREVSFHPGSILLIVLIILAGGLFVAVSDAGKKFDNLVYSFWGNDKKYTHSFSWESDPVKVVPGEDRLVIKQHKGTIKLVSGEDGENLYISSITGVAGSRNPAKNGELLHPVVKREGNLVTVSFPELKGIDREDYKVDLTVKIPGEIPVHAGNELGRIVCDGLKGSIKANSDLGTIDLNNINGNIEAKTQGGKIEIKNPGGDAKVSTNFGKILFFSQNVVSGNYHLKSSIGEIDFRVPAESNLTINAEADLGEIEVLGVIEEYSTENRGPNKKSSIVMGNGEGTANISVDTGSIKISGY